jgi:hypothetical protein
MISTIRTKNRIPGYTLYIHDRTKRRIAYIRGLKIDALWTKNRTTPSKNRIGISVKNSVYWSKNRVSFIRAIEFV